MCNRNERNTYRVWVSGEVGGDVKNDLGDELAHVKDEMERDDCELLMDIV